MKRSWKSILLKTLKVTVITCLLLFLAGLVAAGSIVAVYSTSLPSTEDLRENYQPPQSNRFYAADGTVIGETYVERRSVVLMPSVPRVVVNAILAAEDADFFEHEGLDYPGIFRALIINILKGGVSQGASTITQQVARTFYLGRERTFKRKIRELLLARRIEQNMSKEEILFLYINQIYWGHGRYGIQEASLYYTGKEVSELSLAESALLAGMPRGPEIYSPFKNMEKALKRRNWVLSQMHQHAFITKKEAELARAEPMPEEPHAGSDPGLGTEFVDFGLAMLDEVVGKENASRGGYKVYTTMKPDIQKAAKDSVTAGLKKLDLRHGFRGPVGFKKTSKHGFKSQKCRWHPSGVKLEPDKKPVMGRIYTATVLDSDDEKGLIFFQLGSEKGAVNIARHSRYNPDKLTASRLIRKECTARVSLVDGKETFRGEKVARLRLEMGPETALVAIDVESSKVVAMVGAYVHRRGDFNRALKARRQPGSAFKPIVYLTALKSRKITPATIIEDAPLTYEDYQPRNYEQWHFEGNVRLRKALAESINLVAIRVAEKTGIKDIVKLAGELGITSKLEPNLALALGASGVTPLELANAYGTIARNGIKWEPVIVTKIVGPDGVEIPLPPLSAPERVITVAEAFMITNMLESVIKEGTGKAALGLKRPCAGKTGTSNRARDAWFVGFVPTLVSTVWVGFDDYKSLGKNETGAKAALPIWLRFMKAALGKGAMHRFGLPPEGIVYRSIDPETGLLAYDGQTDAITEVFLMGTEPTEQAEPPDEEILIEDIPETTIETSGETGEVVPDSPGAAPTPAPEPAPAPAPEP